jgi:hypothetical protein
MSFYQIILVLIVSVFFIKSLTSLLQSINLGRLALSLVWFVVLVFALFPDLAHRLSEKSGMGENLNTLIFIGFIIIFVFIFMILKSIEQIKRDISEIVKKDALKNIDNFKNKNN